MSELAFAQNKRVMRQIKFTEDEFNCDEAEVTIEQAQVFQMPIKQSEGIPQDFRFECRQQDYEELAIPPRVHQTNTKTVIPEVTESSIQSDIKATPIVSSTPPIASSTRYGVMFSHSASIEEVKRGVSQPTSQLRESLVVDYDSLLKNIKLGSILKPQGNISEDSAFSYSEVYKQAEVASTASGPELITRRSSDVCRTRRPSDIGRIRNRVFRPSIIVNEPTTEKSPKVEKEDKQLQTTFEVLDKDVRDSNESSRMTPEQSVIELNPPDSNSQPTSYRGLFDIPTYLQSYYALRHIQQNLRNDQLAKALKAYLELVASGKIDDLSEACLSQNKKALLKKSLLLERVSIVVVAFTLACDMLKQAEGILLSLMKHAVSCCHAALRVLGADVPEQVLKELDVQSKTFLLTIKKEPVRRCLDVVNRKSAAMEESIFRLSKYDQLFYQNLKKFIDNSHKFTTQQTFYFILEYFAFFINLCQIDSKVPFLAVAPNPYLMYSPNDKYTLVIDVQDVMCNPRKKGFRPYSQHFLTQMAEFYQIVAFSAVLPNQIARSLNALDPQKVISHKLYRHHASKVHGRYVKDVSRLGRDLSRIISLESQDNDLGRDNRIVVKQWMGGSQDTCLADLCPLLAMIANNRMDSRQAVSRYRQQALTNDREGVKYLNYGIKLG